MAQVPDAATSDSGTPAEKAPRKRAKATSARAGSGGKSAAAKTKPYGKEEVVESIIDATLSMWTAKGPAEISLRSIAARAGVNYGLVYRHFRTKEAVIRAAMDRVVARSVDSIKESGDLVEALDSVLPRSTGAHARLLAWAILQYLVDDILPAEDVFLRRLRALAQAESADGVSDPDTTAKVKAGSLLAMLYGWRLFEPYLVRGLELEQVGHDELDALIRERILKVLAD